MPTKDMLDKVQEQAGQSAERSLADTGYATGSKFEQTAKEQRDVVVALPQIMRPNPRQALCGPADPTDH
ncbi:MAG: hypothetical protein GWP08_17965 [Nitrospiraceae bacterium]|nr:hypothetical protein [Nitrospiraceae bacterium]